MIRYWAILPLLLCLGACDKVHAPGSEIAIESPLRNICQSGELDPVLPRCVAP